MGGATFCIGLLPGYASWGALSAFLLVGLVAPTVVERVRRRQSPVEVLRDGRVVEIGVEVEVPLVERHHERLYRVIAGAVGTAEPHLRQKRRVGLGQPGTGRGEPLAGGRHIRTFLQRQLHGGVETQRARCIGGVHPADQ